MLREPTHRRTFAIVPAAGSGTRFGGAVPKQYAPLAGQPLLVRTLARLLACAFLERVYVVLAPDDAQWRRLDLSALDAARFEPVFLGGSTRARSVLAGLRVAHAAGFGEDDWALVHDAARPCVLPEQITHLWQGLMRDDIGAILAVPVADTVKLADEHERIVRTVPRERLWLAQTPQVFRAGLLRQALEATPEATDEASAVERLGMHPRLVAGHWANLKVTRAADLALAEAIWRWQEAGDSR